MAKTIPVFVFAIASYWATQDVFSSIDSIESSHSNIDAGDLFLSLWKKSRFQPNVIVKISTYGGGHVWLDNVSETSGKFRGTLLTDVPNMQAVNDDPLFTFALTQVRDFKIIEEERQAVVGGMGSPVEWHNHPEAIF